ncbi:MAG: nicotinamidase [Bacteroidales bacterium]|nr:MAG: nicotinamidase [Bacteroidales bacterium]
MKNRLLLIIDPQIDFITGSLPVPGAEQAMNLLSEYLRSNSCDYTHVIVTADRHPMRHCSFKSEGGKWQTHCVADSVGAAIFPPIMDRLLDIPDKVTILHKGENTATEEYSILKNKDAAERILAIIKDKNIEQTDICGLAGDVCVADTIRDWMTYPLNTKLNVLKEFTPSIDGGKTLDSLISDISRHG